MYIGTPRDADEAPAGSAGARESGAAAALIVAALAGLLLHAAYLFREPVDDAGISVAYARTVVEGHGFRINPESAAAEGFSNPSWTCVLILLELMGLDSVLWLRPLGVAFTALGLALIGLWGSAAGRRKLRLEDALGPLIGAAHPSFVHWAQGGLEMGMQVLAMGAVGLCALGPHTKRRATCLGAAVALLTLTRPEGALYACAAGVAWPLSMLAARRRPSHLEVRVAATALLPVLAYLTFRRLYFFEWLPNTYFSKHAWDLNVAVYLREFYEAYTPLLHATAAGLVLAMLGGRGVRLHGVVSGLSVAALVYFTYWAKGDWMREWRFLAVSAPFMGATIGAGIGGVRRLVGSGLQRLGQSRPYLPQIELAVGALLVAYTSYHLLPSELARSERVKSIGWDVAITLQKGQRLGSVYGYLAHLGMAHPLVMASDMGVIALGMRDTELWDFAGLTDPAVSHHFDEKLHSHGAALYDYVDKEGPPSVALAWGPGNFFPTSPIARHYREIIPRHYILRDLTPESDPPCPDGKAAVLATPVDSLVATILAEARAGEPVRALARWRCAHAYRDDRRLPSQAQRDQMAEVARDLAEHALEQGQRENALRQYSLCAVLSIRNQWVSGPCRKRAEQLRVALFNR